MNIRQYPGRPSPPLTLRMMVVNAGIKTGIYENGRLLSHAELASPDVISRLPPPLTQFLQSHENTQEHVYLLAWPDAKSLYDAAKPYTSPTFLLQCEAIERLIPIERPANFAIHWAYDEARKQLERHLRNAEQHLGKGWFQNGRYVWQLDRAIPDEAIRWISTSQIPERNLFAFVSQFMPLAQRARWPVTCDLSILHNFTPHLEIFKALDHSMDVQLIGNVAGITDHLRALEGDSENMISGTMMLAGLRQVMSDKLLDLAHSASLVHIEGAELPIFLQDEVRPRAKQLGVDSGLIDQKYPVVDASMLHFAWKLEHSVVEGVGRYVARPYIGNYPLQTLAGAIENAERFHSVEKGWLEFSPAFKHKYYQWVSNGIGEFQVNIREMLGLRSSRLKLSQLQMPFGTTDQHSGNPADFLASLRAYGLPAGFSGAQSHAIDILVEQCQRLITDYPEAKILWVVPQKKRAAVALALQHANVAYASAEFASRMDKHVTLLAPGASVELAKNWTLIIFQDLDRLAYSDAQIHFYSQLNRRWALATFTAANWHENSHQVLQIMRALELVPENLSRFLELCVRAYPDEPLIAPSTLPEFREVTAPEPITFTEPDTEPDTEPEVATQPVPVPAARSEPIVYVTSDGNNQTKESFFAQARRYVNRAPSLTDPVPFVESWPTYDAMTPAQEHWYFYWRSQVRQGKYLPADLSYLFVHIYEILNLIGFATPQSAFDYLVNFWRRYRVAQPKLDSYLVDWLADFAAVYKLSIKPLGWYDEARREGAAFGDFDLYFEAWAQSGGHFTELPSTCFYRLADYLPTKTKFYVEHHQDHDLDFAYKKGVQAVDDYLRQNGKSLVELYRPAGLHAITREPFAGALHEADRRPILIAQTAMWSADRPLSATLTSIIKYTENILRKQVGFKSKLQGITLPDEWQTVLDQAFIPEVPRREIEINTSLVNVLKRESQEIRQRLIMDDDSSEGLATDLAHIQAIMAGSDSTAIKLLCVLREHNWSADEAVLQAAIDHTHILDDELDYLNKRASKELGDALIFKENGQIVVAEDYRDEIEYVLDQPDADIDTVSSPVVVVPAGKYDDLTEVWAKFAYQMKPQHWDALMVLLAQVDVNARLAAIARSIYSTVSGLIDDINTFALDSIGDIVISPEGDIPYIEEEDMNGLRMLMEWANKNALLER